MVQSGCLFALPDYGKLELLVGDATLDLSAQEIRELIGGVLARATQAG